MMPTPETWSFETSRIGRRVLGVSPPDEQLDPNDPRRLVAEALGYLTNNRERMDYPRYRKLGLPITSSLVESLVGRKAAWLQKGYITHSANRDLASLALFLLPRHRAGLWRITMTEASSSADVQTRKAAIREQARKLRIAQKNKEELSRLICERFMALPAYASANVVMWYVDAGSEVRTRHSLPSALQHGKKVVVPWCIVETNQLELFWLEDMAELVEGAYKILEPKAELRELPAKKVKPDELDLVMVPGTAFDTRGGRMGQGKGYYDRLLANTRAESPLVGIAFECQLFDEIPVHSHDIFMDWVLTESRELRGRGRSQ